MKNIGIWMDKEKAKIVVLDNGKESLETLSSEIEFFNPKGGSRSKTRWGPQDVVQDSKYLEREKHQMKAYFKNILPSLRDANKIALFGPADTIDKFNIELEDNYPDIFEKVKTVTKKDSMTDNQVRALVRDFFQD
ncbi:hypothetical protein [Flagellimonas allohymeniacidonis]|uniref:Host attachment protein n=1 Tax=Flagellimonas allohymeniacidonis TaxID=2517819 RepID=A0A4Q8QLM5_9FLAO|nr:hypothetical protein [Allomuricauda hymeniacidonis]TAI49753.1 hypothetical protein EW142_08130 [Allomuricauda hymeniacidonis]